MSLPGSQGDDDGSGIGQGHLPDDGRPARVGRPLQTKEEENPAKEAFNGTAFAQFFFGPRGRQAGAVLLSLGIPWNHSNGSQGRVDPVDELQAPIGRIEPDDAGMQVVEAHCQFEQGTRKGGIMGIGGPDQEVDRQPGAATEQRMHAIAPQERTRMVSRSVTQGRIRIGAAPRQDGGTINDQITGADQPRAQGAPHGQHEEAFKGGCACGLPALTQLGSTGNTWGAVSALRQAAGQRQGRPASQPVMHILIGEPEDAF